MSGPHDIPDAAALVEAVREFLERDVLASTTGRVQFHTRVAINVLGMVEREIGSGREDAARHAAGLATFGVASEAELAAGIRSGRFDHRIGEVTEFVTETVRDKLGVANPRYPGFRSRSS